MIAIRSNLQAALLTIVAGMADAVGYISLGGIFAANMTGNTVLAGIAVAEGQYALAGRQFMPLIAFFLGALLARLLLRLLRKPSAPLLLEAALLALAGFVTLGTEVVAGARLVVDHDLLAEPPAEVLGDQPGHDVEDAGAGRRRHHEAQRMARPSLRHPRVRQHRDGAQRQQAASGQAMHCRPLLRPSTAEQQQGCHRP